MRLKEFKIDRYGPLSYREAFKLGSFNLFFGLNEAGKSLTIDALVKLITGGRSRVFEKINRVEEMPSGYVLINSGDNNIKFTAGTSNKRRKEIFGEKFSESMFRNIFIVRSSDLTFNSGRDFFMEIAKRKTGIDTELISRLRENILDITNLTATNLEFKNTERNRLKDRVKKAAELISELEIMINEMRKIDFDKLLIKKVDIERNIDEIDNEIEILEKVEKHERYKKGLEAVEKLERAVEELKKYSEFDESIRQKWNDILLKSEGISQTIDQYSEKLRSLEREIDDLDNKLKEERLRFNEYTRKIEDINRLRPYIEYFKDKDIGDIKNSNLYRKIFRPVIIGSIFMFFVFIFVSILKSSKAALFLAFISGFTPVIYLGLFKLRQKSLIRKWKDLLTRMPYIGYRGNDYIELVESIKKFEDDYRFYREKYNLMENKSTVLKKRREELVNDIQRKKSELELLKIENDDFLNRFKVKDYEEYCKKLDKKEELENIIDNMKSVLYGIFGSTEDKDPIGYWKECLLELEQYKDFQENVDYNEGKKSSLKSRRDELSAELENLDSKLVTYDSKLNDIEKRVGGLLGDESVRCETLRDLELVKVKLKEFIESAERNKRYGKIAVDIFKSIEERRREDISGMFGRGKYVSELFKRITGGVYEEVNYDTSSSKVYVVDREGNPFYEEKLSAGAYDQLYFSIRLAIANNVMNEECFFIMDDPFIRSDYNRLERQLNLLYDLSGSNWQILYFSAKNEVRDILKQKIENGEIKYFPVKSYYNES